MLERSEKERFLEDEEVIEHRSKSVMSQYGMRDNASNSAAGVSIHTRNLIAPVGQTGLLHTFLNSTIMKRTELPRRAELRRINIDDEKLCTYQHDTNTWIEVPRPQRVVGRKAVDIAASGFKKIWERHDSPFFCPHKRRSGRSFEPLVLSIAMMHAEQTIMIALLKAHVMLVIIPPLKKTKTLISWQDRRRHEEEEDDSSDHESAQHSASVSSSSSVSMSSSSVSTALTSSVSSLSHATNLSTSSVNTLVLQAMKSPHPRYCGPRAISPIKPTPTHLGAGKVHNGPGPRGVQSFYKQKVADARKDADISIMEYIHQIAASGILDEDPTTHPAWDPASPPTVLQLYDTQIYPNCLDQIHANVDFLYKPLGQIIQDLNQVIGVTFHDFNILARSSRHLEPCSPTQGQIQFRTYRDDDARPEYRGCHMKTPIGAALLAWNSRLGVPADVWMIASTAVIHCKECDLIRTFPAHFMHLDDNTCSDAGQAVVAPPGEA
ncbi:hypothetical protein K438DRAFT_2079321 [Mycena galopus ATCC 62051]|nr:hypothetical protein K438DRAFT_2079321 [Mycena galopus ATCC 62051]